MPRAHSEPHTQRSAVRGFFRGDHVIHGFKKPLTSFPLRARLRFDAQSPFRATHATKCSTWFLPRRPCDPRFQETAYFVSTACAAPFRCPEPIQSHTRNEVQYVVSSAETM